jgi:hypothetical protein
MMTRRRLLTAMAGGSTMLLAPRARAQLDPGTDGYLIYTITQGTVTLGQVLVTNLEGGGYNAQTEYWYMNAAIDSSTEFIISAGTAQPWSNPPTGLGTLSFGMADESTWTLGTPSGTIHVYHNILTKEYDGLQFNMSVNVDGVWSGSITWWKLTDSAGYLLGPGDVRTFQPQTLSGNAYYITTSPL